MKLLGYVLHIVSLISIADSFYGVAGQSFGMCPPLLPPPSKCSSPSNSPPPSKCPSSPSNSPSPTGMNTPPCPPTNNMTCTDKTKGKSCSIPLSKFFPILEKIPIIGSISIPGVCDSTDGNNQCVSLLQLTCPKENGEQSCTFLGPIFGFPPVQGTCICFPFTDPCVCYPNTFF